MGCLRFGVKDALISGEAMFCTVDAGGYEADDGFLYFHCGFHGGVFCG